MITRLLCAAAFGLTLAACGGGGGGGDNSPPPSAPSNNAPVAVAGEDFTQALASSGTQLDGSGSSDADGDTLSYSWSITSQPAGASASFDNASAAQPRLQTLVPGVYQIELRVSDGRGGSSTDTVEADLTNDDPVLNLAPIQSSIAVGIPLALDATGSSDPNGQPLSYTWTVTSAPADSRLLPTFTGPAPLIELDAEGDFDFTLEVSDGYASVSDSFAITASTYYEAILEDGFDQVVMSATRSLVEPSSLNALGARLNTPTDPIAVTSQGSIVRVVAIDGSTQRSFDLPQPVERLVVAPNGAWVGIEHANEVSIINLATNEVATWATSSEPTVAFIYSDGFLFWTSETEVDPKIIATNPATGDETPGPSIRPNSPITLIPNAPLAYAVTKNVSPDLMTRYLISDLGVIEFERENTSSAYERYCENLWPSEDSNQILTACGIVVARTDDAQTDMQFVTELEISGTIIDAAYQSSSQQWFIIEDRDGFEEVNVYNGESGRWLATLALPEVSAGEPTVPLSVNVNQDTQIATIFAADHQTNPSNFALFRLAEVNTDLLNLPPVTIVPRYTSGFVQQPISIYAGQSYDREGQSVAFDWSLISEPDGSALSLADTDQPELQFTPAVAGTYVFSLVTNDGNRQADARTVDVTVFEQGKNLQVRLNGTPSDVIYNTATNQLLYTSSQVERLTILDLDTMRERIVELDRIGQAVDVSPNGSFAAVSHTGLASLIDLNSMSRSPTDTEILNVDWGDIVIDDRQIAFMVPDEGQFVDFNVIDFANDETSTAGSPSAGSILRMLPSGGAVYLVSRRAFPNSIARFDVSNLSQITISDSPDLSESFVNVNGNAWITAESDRMLTGGGTVLRLSDVLEQDLTFVENLSPDTLTIWADHSPQQGLWAAVVQNTVRYFSDTTYNQTGTQDIESLYIDRQGTEPNINQVFFSDDETRLIVVAQSPDIAESGHVIQIIR